MTDSMKKEFTLRVSQANPISMITILYEIALVYLQDAEMAYKLQDKKGFVHALHMTQDTIRQLQESLNIKYEPAPALLKLYVYIHRMLAQAITYFDIALLEEPEKILTRLKDAYIQLEKTGNWESVMVNTQIVYAGYTYGKNSMVDSFSSESSNRGFLA